MRPITTEKVMTCTKLNKYFPSSSPKVPSYIIDSELEPKNVESFFRSEKDAIFSLYEELFDSSEDIDLERIHNAFKYLLWQKGMMPQYEEIIEMGDDYLCVIHREKARKETEEAIKYYKHRMSELIEEC